MMSREEEREISIYSGHPSTGTISLGSRRPAGNRSVMESMHKRYGESDEYGWLHDLKQMLNDSVDVFDFITQGY